MASKPLVAVASPDRSRPPHSSDETVWVSVFLATTLIAISLIQLLFVLHHSMPVPYWDESGYIPYVTGSKPITLTWLWSQANEHRIPLTRIVYVILARITGLDQQWMNAFNVTMLGATSLLLMWVMRRINGRSQYTDAIVPLVLLHFGHASNLTWPNQIQFVLPTCLFLAAVALLMLEYTVLVAPIVLAILLCGANGLPIGLALLPAVVWIGLELWPISPKHAIFNFGCTLLAFAYAGLYLVGLMPAMPPPRPFVFREGIEEGFHVCVQAIGPFARELWPYPVIGVFLLLAVCLWLVTRRLRQLAAFGLGLALLGLIGLGFGIGLGRTILGPGAGFAARYALLMSPFLIVAILVFDRFASPGVNGFVRMGVLVAAAMLYWPNGQQEIAGLEIKMADANRLEEAVKQGASIDSLAAEYGPRWMFTGPIFAEHMREMAKARMGIYRRYAPPADAGR